MALTLTEAQKLSNDQLLIGVVETILKQAPLMRILPFIPIAGNGLTYNREDALTSINFYDVGDIWAEATPTFTQLTATLKILGGDADVDAFLARTRGNLQDIEAAIIMLRAKALADKIEDALLNGQSSGAATPDTGFVVSSKAFDGLAKLIPGDATGGATTVQQAASMGTNGATLTLAKIDEVIDLVQGGKPDALIMSKRSARTLTALGRTTTAGYISNDVDDFGQAMMRYQGIPIYRSDYVSDAQTQGSSTDCSTIYAVRLGEGAFAGLSSVGAPSIVEVERVGPLETKDAVRTRVKAYVSCALFNTKAAAKLIGVRT